MAAEMRERSLDLTLAVLLLIIVIGLWRGADAASWALAWVYTLINTLAALAIGYIGAFGGGDGDVEITLDKKSLARRGFASLLRPLAIWALLTLLATIYLVARGHILFMLPLASLMVFVFPDAEDLVADEYVRQVMAKAAALGGSLAFALGLLAIVFYKPLPLELLAAMLAVYLITIEWAAFRALR